MDFAFTIAGFIVGFVVGLTGVGGGSLMTPILVLFFHISPSIAVGTDLLYAAITKGGGVWLHARNGTVQWRIVGLLASGSIPTSIATVFLLDYLDAQGINYDRAITTSLSIALILTSGVILFKTQILALSRFERLQIIKDLHHRLQTPITVLVGMLLGTLVTLSSVGAGALGAAILFLLYPRLPSIAIVGTDLAHAVPLTAIAGLGHYHLGSVDFTLLTGLLIGSLPGIYLGSHLGMNLPERVIRPLLATMLLGIGVRFAF